ncbi:hypothetical protein D3C85_1837160 [compost metagenome]
MMDVTNMILLLQSMVDALLDKSKPDAQLSAFSKYVIEDGLHDVKDELEQLFLSM